MTRNHDVLAGFTFVATKAGESRSSIGYSARPDTSCGSAGKFHVFYDVENCSLEREDGRQADKPVPICAMLLWFGRRASNHYCHHCHCRASHRHQTDRAPFRVCESICAGLKLVARDLVSRSVQRAKVPYANSARSTALDSRGRR